METPVSATAEFAATFRRFMEQALSTDEATPFFVTRLRAHFGADPASLPTVSDTFEPADHPNVQLALDSVLRRGDRSFECMGATGPNKNWGLGLAELLAPAGRGLRGDPAASFGPVEYTTLALDGDHTMTAVQHGIFLLSEGERRLVLVVQGPVNSYSRNKVSVEVMAPSRADAESLLGEIRREVRESNLYKGKVISLAVRGDEGALSIRFHRLPPVGPGDIVLPEGVLEQLERHTIGFVRHKERLLASGRHLRRGLLLYGPPGTGKTLSAMYLAGRMPDRTVILLTGQGFKLTEQACRLARLLQPAMVVLEDVDLVAEERTRENSCGVVLFDLLNQMDGLDEDADVIFLLTTNRPDILEPALAARPGRIDQAIHVPLPDHACRRRLLALYGAGLTLDLPDPETLVDHTDGVSAAFMKELLRRAALIAADETPDNDDKSIRVAERHVDQALRELVVDGGELTQSLLGARSARSL
jgi:hypothetical protein